MTLDNVAVHASKLTLRDRWALYLDLIRWSRPQGWLLLEHGYDQAEAVCLLLAQHGFSEVQSRVDLAGITRCSGGRWPGHADLQQTAG